MSSPSSSTAAPRARRLAVVAAAVLAGVGATAAPLAGAGRAQAQPPSARPLALVYRGGSASCDGCSSAVAALLRRSPLHFRVQYVGPHQRRPLTAAGLRGAALYAQPGGDGDVTHALRALGRPAVRAIRAYVAGGGRYVGFCMGAYLAGSGPGIGLLAPGNTDEYDQTRGASVTTTHEAVIPVYWGRTLYHQYAQDPPYIIASHVRGERILSRFTNGRINALVRPYRRGAVAVVGTHPEADRSWFTGRMWRRDPDRLTGYRPGLELIAAVMQIGG